MIRYFSKFLSLALLTIFLPTVISFHEVSAASLNVSNEISDKALYQGIYKCYTKGHVKSKISSLSEYSGTTTLTSEPLKYLVKDTDSSDENFVPFATGWAGRGYDVYDYGVSCYQLLNGGQFVTGGYAGNILKAFDKNIPKVEDAAGVIALTEDMGYEIIASEDACYSLKYNTTQQTNQVCQSSDGNLYADDTQWDLIKFTASGKEVCLRLPADYTSTTERGCKSLGNEQFSGDWLMGSVNAICGSLDCSYTHSYDGPGGGRLSETNVVHFDHSVAGGASSGISLKNSSASFKNNNASDAAMIAILYFNNGSIKTKNPDEILITDLEKRKLYQAYLTDYYNVEINCETGLSDSAFDGKINWLDNDGKIKECHYETNNATHQDKKVNGIQSGYYVYESLSFSDLIKAIQKLPTRYSDINNIEKCYNTAQENIERLNEIAEKLKSTTVLSDKLIQVARDLADGKKLPTYTSGGANGAQVTPNIENGVDIYGIVMFDDSLSKSEAAKNFANSSKAFSNAVIEYNKKSLEEPLSNSDIEDLKQKISDYENTRNVFRDNFTNKVNDYLADSLPVVNINSMWQNYDGISNLDNTVRMEVENFYKINEQGDVICLYNEKVEEIRNKISELLGAPIEFKKYAQDQPDADDTNTEDADCYDAGVEGMSWILCPALNNTTSTVDGIEQILREWLSIKEEDFFNNKVYEGWNIFRNIANGLLIIVLLVVIFSQLTGMGIDNYGIKKMLPRLIMMGILINLSYIVCQLAVELSNILGVGLDNIMKGVGNTINGGTDPDYTVSSIVTGILAGIAAAGGIAAVAGSAASGGWQMVVVMLLLAVLVALVAVLMFFVMLSARIIIVAVFMVIAPVALACYILPGTQGLFKKWWKVFEAALVVFPICGALYGASYIVKAIVGGDSGGFVPGIIAVVSPFLPFLILPTLLKGALAGLGAIGGALTMLGNGLKKGAVSGEGAIKNSNRFKDFQARREEGRATKTFDKLNSKLNKNGTLSARQRSRYLRAGSVVDRSKSEREKVYNRGFSEMSRDQVQGVLSDALKGNDVERANAAFNSLLDKGGIDEAFKVLGGANWATMDSRVSSQLLRSMGGSNIDIMKAFSKYRQSGGAAGFQNWANNSRSAQEIADDARVGAKVQSLAQHLAENGEHAMDGYGKDEAEFIASHISGIQSGMGAAFKKDFGSMMGSAGLNSKDAKAQAVWDKLITNELSKATPGSIDVDDLGMVADSFGIMREGMSHAVRQGVENYISSTSGTAATAAQVTAAIQGALADQISAAQASSIIKDRAKTGVLKDFGITP